MAKFYLRPSEDISNNHTLYPSSSTTAYLLVNEEVADDASTYISLVHSGTKSTATSQFKLSGNVPSDLVKIKNIKIIHRSKRTGNNAVTAKIDCSISVNDHVVTTTANVTNLDYYSNFIHIPSSIVDVLNNSNPFPEIYLTITTTCSSGGSGKSATADTSQIYVEITYSNGKDIGVYKKINEEWVAATQAYKKINNVWTEIEEDECKQILQNSLCMRGE